MFWIESWVKQYWIDYWRNQFLTKLKYRWALMTTDFLSLLWYQYYDSIIRLQRHTMFSADMELRVVRSMTFEERHWVPKENTLHNNNIRFLKMDSLKEQPRSLRTYIFNIYGVWKWFVPTEQLRSLETELTMCVYKYNIHNIYYNIYKFTY